MQFAPEPMTNRPDTQPHPLQRTIALVLSLAHLADRARAMPWPIRVFVVWVLGRAEAAIFDHAHWNMDETISPYGEFAPETAEELAESFRILAFMLEHEMAQDRIFQGWWAARDAEAQGSAVSCDAAADPSTYPDADSLISCAIRGVMLAISHPGSTRRAGFVGLVPGLDSS